MTQPSKFTPKGPRYCGNCGQPGHYSTSCKSAPPTPREITADTTPGTMRVRPDQSRKSGQRKDAR